MPCCWGAAAPSPTSSVNDLLTVHLYSITKPVMETPSATNELWVPHDNSIIII